MHVLCTKPLLTMIFGLCLQLDCTAETQMYTLCSGPMGTTLGANRRTSHQISFTQVPQSHIIGNLSQDSC